MTLTEILEQNGVTKEGLAAIMAAMKENKIFTSSEENIDIRYGKLKTDHDSKSKELDTANATIEELRKASKGHEAMQAKLAEYDKQVAALQAELEAAKFDGVARAELMAAGAVDVDYSLFQLKEAMKADGKEAKLDESGKIGGWDGLLSGLKTKSPNLYKAEDANGGYEVFEPNKLKTGDPNLKPTVTKEEFDKMGYTSRAKLKQENPDVYAQLTK